MLIHRVHNQQVNCALLLCNLLYRCFDSIKFHNIHNLVSCNLHFKSWTRMTDFWMFHQTYVSIEELVYLQIHQKSNLRNWCSLPPIYTRIRDLLKKKLGIISSWNLRKWFRNWFIAKNLIGVPYVGEENGVLTKTLTERSEWHF